jgi:hypothetical protein
MQRASVKRPELHQRNVRSRKEPSNRVWSQCDGFENRHRVAVFAIHNPTVRTILENRLNDREVNRKWKRHRKRKALRFGAESGKLLRKQ